MAGLARNWNWNWIASASPSPRWSRGIHAFRTVGSKRPLFRRSSSTSFPALGALLIILIVQAVVAPTVRGAAENAPGLNLATAFDEANRLYEQNRFGAAADAYEQLLKSGQNTVPVHFNLGNARFRNGELGRAILAYLQAQRLAPRDSDIQTNLQAARRAVGGPDAGTPTLTTRFLTWLAPSEWLLLASAGVGLFFTLLSLREWKPQFRNAFGSLLVTCVVIAAIAGLCGWMTLRDARQEWGVITSREVTVRYTPLEESPVHFTALDGAELRILGSKTDSSSSLNWLEVQDWSGRSGWLKASQITRVAR